MTRLQTMRAEIALWKARVAGRLAARPLLRGRFADAGLLGAIAAIHLIFSRAFLFGAFGFDEQYFLYEGFALGKGMIPYRDFQEFKPPLIFFLNMLALKIFGLDEMRFRRFFLLLSLAAFLVVAVALLSRGVPRLVILGATALMLNTFLDARFLQGGTLDAAECAGLWFFLLGVGVLIFKVPRPAWQRWQQWVGGALLALAPLAKEPFCFPTLFAWGTLAVLSDAESDSRNAPNGPPAWRQFAKNTASAAIAVAVLWLLYMLVTRSFGAYLANLRETMVYSAEHDIMYGVFPKLGFWGTWGENWSRLRSSYVNPAFLAPFLPYFLAAVLLWRGRSMSMAAGLVATFLGALYGVTIGHGFFGHYFIIAMTGSFFATALGCLALGERVSELRPHWRRWLGASLALMALYALKPRLEQDWEQWRAPQPPPPPVSQQLVRLVDARTAPRDTIWSVGTPAIYFYADRRAGSRIPYIHDSLLHLYPGQTPAEKLRIYRAELDVKMPKLVILTEGRAGREQHMDLLVTPFLRDHGYQLISGRDAAEVPVYQRPY
jgi:hypothetical protein